MKHFFFIFIVIRIFAQELNVAPQILDSKIEKKLVVCIASFNNEKYFKRNLSSVFSQNYSNYRVIYVDDASTDETFNLVSDYIKESGYKDKVELIRNDSNLGAMCNHYNMVSSCDDDEIIVTLDGDDWFLTDSALQRVNQAYLDPNVWVTYGSFRHWPGKWESKNICVPLEDLKEGRHREQEFIWSHIRTFYAGLFKQIPIKQFKNDEGLFFSVACDVAIMLNLIDLAREHVYCIPEILYSYNVETPIRDFRKGKRKMRRVTKFISERVPLDRADSWSL
ncbi:MAG: hypothetical protein S4CHLAM20_05680 [Chlamydiia bacterium]|nr:hypothetical protein [Chlamydiia bacterium]